MSEIWFARRFPVGHARNAMAPVHWKGWVMFGAFIANVLVGALGFLLSSLNGGWLWGIIVFAALSAMGAGMLLIAVSAHGDATKTVEDYRKAKANA
jgi:F0F1-type ATP synthase assembly protein I